MEDGTISLRGLKADAKVFDEFICNKAVKEKGDGSTAVLPVAFFFIEVPQASLQPIASFLTPMKSA